MEDGRKIYTVSELNREIKAVLEDSYPAIWLEGEVSNCRQYPSGHIYLTLKDAESQISAVIFQGVARYMRFKVEDGLKVLVRGRVSAYTPRGDYQVIVAAVEPAGKGALQLAFEQLKEKLQKEGLFDASRKRPLPLLPHRIGIVTSSRGAAIRDILCILDRRYANVEVLLYPVRVQGEGAKDEIAGAIRFLNRRYPGLDVLLVGRGGGSYEDLWAFNEEIVARAIAESRIPVISCVGHEIDFTIADFVADLRAPTPSAAAELVVRDKAELMNRLSVSRQRLTNAVYGILNSLENRLRHAASARVLRSPTAMIEDSMQRVDGLSQRMARAMDQLAERKAHALSLVAGKLNLLSPLTVLERGYAVCWKEPGHRLLKKASELQRDDRISVRLSEGEITARVE